MKALTGALRFLSARALAILSIAAMIGAPAAFAGPKDPLASFPPAADGLQRHVLRLPPEAEEDLLKVELVLGKTVMLDPLNRYFFGGKIEVKTVEGFGYVYYELEKLGPMAGTLMAIQPDAPKVERFIALGGEPYLIRYNSRLPVVIDVPAEVEVGYRIWRTEPEPNFLQPLID